MLYRSCKATRHNLLQGPHHTLDQRLDQQDWWPVFRWTLPDCWNHDQSSPLPSCCCQHQSAFGSGTPGDSEGGLALQEQHQHHEGSLWRPQDVQAAVLHLATVPGAAIESHQIRAERDHQSYRCLPDCDQEQKHKFDGDLKSLELPLCNCQRLVHERFDDVSIDLAQRRDKAWPWEARAHHQ